MPYQSDKEVEEAFRKKFVSIDFWQQFSGGTKSIDILEPIKQFLLAQRVKDRESFMDVEIKESLSEDEYMEKGIAFNLDSEIERANKVRQFTILEYSRTTSYCKHPNGVFFTVHFWIFKKRLFWCTDCDSAIEAKQILANLRL